MGIKLISLFLLSLIFSFHTADQARTLPIESIIKLGLDHIGTSRDTAPTLPILKGVPIKLTAKKSYQESVGKRNRQDVDTPNIKARKVTNDDPHGPSSSAPLSRVVDLKPDHPKIWKHILASPVLRANGYKLEVLSSKYQRQRLNVPDREIYGHDGGYVNMLFSDVLVTVQAIPQVNDSHLQHLTTFYSSPSGGISYVRENDSLTSALLVKQGEAKDGPVRYSIARPGKFKSTLEDGDLVIVGTCSGLNKVWESIEGRLVGANIEQVADMLFVVDALFSYGVVALKVVKF